MLGTRSIPTRPGANIIRLIWLKMPADERHGRQPLLVRASKLTESGAGESAGIKMSIYEQTSKEAWD